MSEYPCPIEGGNSGDGSPLVLGDAGVIGDLHMPCDPTTTVHVLDWDGDGEPELVGSGNDIFAHKFVDTLADGTPVVDRGRRWGTISRSAQRDENDEGLTGFVLAAADFNGNGAMEAIIGLRYYSHKPVVALSLAGGASTDREAGLPVHVHGTELDAKSWAKGSTAAVDWNGDGRPDLVVVSQGERNKYHIDPTTGISPEDQRDRYHRDGRWIGEVSTPKLHLFENSGTGGGIEFAYRGTAGVDLPRHTMWASPVDPTNPNAGLLLCTYYGRVYHLPLIAAGPTPQWGAIAELFTMHNEPFNRITNFDINIGVSDALEPGRFDIYAGDRSQSPSWSRFRGHDADGRPVYDTPKKIKQRNPHVGNSFFSVLTVGDWRDTGTPDLVVGGVEGYVLWYKTLSTDPLRFALPERVRYGTTEIRRLAAPNPAGGHHWGGSQGPYDGDTGGYSNPVLVDWNGNGLLDLLVSDMIGLYDWYPNWGTKSEPELGPPQRLYVIDGEPLRGPWRQQAGVGDFSGSGLPDIVIQDKDLDLAVFRRIGPDEPSLLHPAKNFATRTARRSRPTASTLREGVTVVAARRSTSSTGTGTACSICCSASALSMAARIAAATSSSLRTSAPTRAPCSGGPKSSCGTTKASRWSSGGTGCIPPRSTGTATAGTNWSRAPTRGASGTGSRNTSARARPVTRRRPGGPKERRAWAGTIDAPDLRVGSFKDGSGFEIKQSTAILWYYGS